MQYKTVFFGMLILFFIGCKRHLKHEIIAFELQTNRFEVAHITLHDEPVPFYAFDSLKIITDLYAIFYDAKLMSLQNQRYELQQNLLKTKGTYDSVESPIMKQIFDQSIAGIESRITRLEHIQTIYKTQPELTQCNTWIDQMIYYKQLDSLLLGYLQYASIIGSQGLLEKQHVDKYYFLDLDGKTIRAEINFPQTAP